MNKFASALLLMLLLPFSDTGAGDKDKSNHDFFLYSIGNSHTWDFRPAADFLEIGKAMEINIKNGWHINCGQNLETIWDNPGQLADFDYSKEWLSDFQPDDTLEILSGQYFAYLEKSLGNYSDRLKFIPLGKVL